MKKELIVTDIIDKFGATIVYGDENITLDNFSKDTRNINKDDIYIGIKGEKFDGNLFYKDAFEKGAKACIIEKSSNDNFEEIKGKTLITVDNSIKFLQELAAYKRSLYDIPVVAVTGSVGKTSTKDIISHVLSMKYKVKKTEGNYNNHIGLPMTILGLKDHNALVVEMGMNNLSEIDLLSNIAKPTLAVITNIGTAHIGNLGSRENILKAKLEIINGMDEDGILFINNDNDLLNKYKDDININIVTFGIENESDYMAKNIEDNVFSSNFTVDNNNITINVGGMPFIYNSLAAYSIGKYLNIDDKDIIKGIETFKLTNNRMEKINIKNNITIINDTYNASYDSVIAAIDLINKTNNKRRILLLGDILELGDFSKEIHTNIGKYILNKNIDYVILVGNEVKYIEDTLINNNFTNIKRFDKENETYSFLDDFLQEDDIILIKGSHGINLINVVNYLRK